MLAGIALPQPASADLVISQVIVDMSSPVQRRADIQVANRGRGRLYVVVEPFRILNAGKAGERRVRVVDPAKHGLLVSPVRMILEPGQRRVIRFVALSPAKGKDRIFRVTVKPVVGKLKSERAAVRVVVGYDLLVIQRPAKASAQITARRVGRTLVVRNSGNTNALLFRGKQCVGKRCRTLPARRVYGGTSVRIKLPGQGKVGYLLKVGNSTTRRQF